MTPEEEHRLLDFFSAACDEQLNPQSQRELEFFLLEDEAARRLYAEYTQMHCELRFQVGQSKALQRVLENVPTGGPFSRLVGRGRLRRVSLLLSMAASIFLLAGWYVYSSKSTEDFPDFVLVASRESVPVATVSDADGATWGGRTSFAKDDVLLTGQKLRLEQGTATVSMGVGADVMLHAPCGLDLISANSVLLTSGELTVQVADWAKGFRVSAGSIEIEDLGTRFHVSATALGEVKATVIEGQIRVIPLQENLSNLESLVLGKGEGVQLDRRDNQLKRFENQAAESLPEFPEIAPYKPIQIHSTGRGLNIGDEDSHWRIIAGKVNDVFSGPQYAVVCNPDNQYQRDRPDASQWISIAENLFSGSVPDSVYTFETSIDLTGYDLTSAMVSGQLLADNVVEAVRINGEPVTLTPGAFKNDTESFRRIRIVRITEGFRAGINTIEVDVYNALGSLPNPMALRAEWIGFGRLE